jgi:hypothetical protein
MLNCLQDVAFVWPAGLICTNCNLHTVTQRPSSVTVPILKPGSTLLLIRLPN